MLPDIVKCLHECVERKHIPGLRITALEQTHKIFLSHQICVMKSYICPDV